MSSETLDIGTVKPKYSVQKSTFAETRGQYIVMALDVLALFTAYAASVFLFLYHQHGQTMPTLEMVDDMHNSRHVMYSVLCSGMIALLWSRGHYSRRIPWWDQVLLILKLVMLSLFVNGFVSFAFQIEYSRLFIVTNWVLAFSFLMAMRLAVNAFKTHSKAWQLPTVVIADFKTVKNTLYALNTDRSLGFAVHSILLRDEERDEEFDVEELPENYQSAQIYEDPSFYERYILNNPENFYIISLETFRGEKRDALINTLKDNDIDFALIPAISYLSLYNTKPVYFFGNDVMMLRTSKPLSSPIGLFTKRAMDITGALVAAMIFTAPILILAAMVKLEGQSGSPFYGGNRVGKNGRVFKCWKLRTMEPGTDYLLEELLATDPEAKAHWDKYFKLENDPRVQTRAGRLIRKTSLDEIPQFWNVLIGDMSIVGPRPILESEVSAYGEDILDYFSVKPGVTGLWQVSGRNNVSFQRRVIWDTWYVRNWSLWGDIVIIIKTFKAVFARSGAS